MKIFFLIISVFLSTLFIFFFKEIELIAINNLFSWCFSHLLPYLLTILSGIALGISFSGLPILKNKVLRIITITLLVTTPFIIAFIIHPIYEGDFSSEGKEIKAGNTIATLKKYNLAVVTIPGCPYCMGSISRLKLIKKRNPNLQIDFIVTNYGDSTDKFVVSMFNDYKKEIANQFALQFDNSTLNVSSLTARFPTFIYLKNGKPVYKWTNDQFGAGAIDQFEQLLHNNK